jgi:hypothetical protein
MQVQLLSTKVRGDFDLWGTITIDIDFGASNENLNT